MFEQLFGSVSTVEQYRTAPLADSRLRYLRALAQVGSQTLDPAQDCRQSG